MARLGDVATYINGYAFKPDDWSDTGVPIIRIQDLTGNSYQTNRYNGTYAPKYEVNSGDVLISWSASLGVYIWEGETSVLNQHIFKVVFDKLPMNKNYFVYQVEHILKKAQSEAHGATMKHLTKPVFDSLEFNLPSLDEQNRIAAILDKVTSLIALRKQQLAKLDELVKARFVEMFGEPVQNTKHFPTVKMGEACYLKAGITTSADEIHDYSDKYSVPCYGGNGIRGYVKSHTYDGVFPIIGRQGALCGNVQLATGKFHATEHAVLVTPLKGQNSIWLYYLLKYFDLNRFQTGAAQPGLAVKTLNQIEILTANVPVQNKFSDIAIEAYQWGLTIRQNLDTLEILKKALIQEFLQ